MSPAPRTSVIDRMLQRERAQPALEMRADGLHVIEQAVVHQLLEEERRRASRQQVAAVRAAVIARRDRLRDALGHEAAPTGTPAPSALPTEMRSGASPSACA